MGKVKKLCHHFYINYLSKSQHLPNLDSKNFDDHMELSMQCGNPFASKPEMNRRRAEGLYLGWGRTGHYFSSLSYSTVQGNSGQPLLMPAPEDALMETGNDTSLGIVALGDN